MRTRTEEMVAWIIQHETDCEPEKARIIADKVLAYIRGLLQ